MSPKVPKLATRIAPTIRIATIKIGPKQFFAVQGKTALIKCMCAKKIAPISPRLIELFQ